MALNLGTLSTWLVVAVAAAAGALYFDKHRKSSELEQLKSDLDAARARASQMSSSLTSQREQVERLQRGVAENTVLQDQRAELTARIAALESDLTAVRESFQTSVQQLRASAAGTPFAELRLVDGQVLRDVKVQAVSDNEVSVMHSGGVARIQLTNMPDELKQRYRLAEFTLPEPTPVPAKGSSATPKTK